MSSSPFIPIPDDSTPNRTFSPASLDSRILEEQQTSSTDWSSPSSDHMDEKDGSGWNSPFTWQPSRDEQHEQLHRLGSNTTIRSRHHRISDSISDSFTRVTSQIKRELLSTNLFPSQLSRNTRIYRANKLVKVAAGLTILLLLFLIQSTSTKYKHNKQSSANGHVSHYDWSNQKFASGKGWGWSVGYQPEASADNRMSGKSQKEYEYAYSQEDTAEGDQRKEYPDIPCDLNVVAFGSQYKLTPNFKYARRYVTAKASPPDSDKVDGFDPFPRKMHEPIVQKWERMAWHGVLPEETCKGLVGQAMDACVQEELAKRMQRFEDGTRSGSQSADDGTQVSSAIKPLSSCSSSQHPLEIPVYPVPKTHTQPHHLILGIASTVDRMFEMLPVMSYSYAYSNLHLILNLQEDPRIPELRSILKSRGIRATIILSPEEDYLRRWVELPSLLLDFSDPGITRWAVVADDDTFFLSLPKLFKTLDKYDHTKNHYIGALTDDWRQAGSGMIAFGGAGVVLSMTLLEEVQPHWAECKQINRPGDYRLASCIYAYTHTRLTIEWGLHQTDLWDDIRGLLESGRDIITWHHWKSWNRGLDPVLLARAGAVCGSECLLQRFLLDGPSSNTSSIAQQAEPGNFLFVHGLSLTLYPNPLPDFSKTEVTWKVWANSEFSHSVGPMRPRIREGRPPLSRLRCALAPKSPNCASASGAGSSWKETWVLEDVRLDEDLGPASSWDNDGRGIREIYIKRAGRSKGYLSGDLFNANAKKEDATLKSNGKSVNEEDDRELSEEERHENARSNIETLMRELREQGHNSEQEAQALKQIMEEEEEDSVIELVWV